MVNISKSDVNGFVLYFYGQNVLVQFGVRKGPVWRSQYVISDSSNLDLHIEYGVTGMNISTSKSVVMVLGLKKVASPLQSVGCLFLKWRSSIISGSCS